MIYNVIWVYDSINEGFVAFGRGFTNTYNYNWSDKDTFTIYSKLIDEYGAESE